MTPLELAREALTKHYAEWCDDCGGERHPADEEHKQGMYPVDYAMRHCRAALAEVDRLAAENAVLLADRDEWRGKATRFAVAIDQVHPDLGGA